MQEDEQKKGKSLPESTTERRRVIKRRGTIYKVACLLSACAKEGIRVLIAAYLFALHINTAIFAYLIGFTQECLPKPLSPMHLSTDDRKGKQEIE